MTILIQSLFIKPSTWKAFLFDHTQLDVAAKVLAFTWLLNGIDEVVVINLVLNLWHSIDLLSYIRRKDQQGNGKDDVWIHKEVTRKRVKVPRITELFDRYGLTRNKAAMRRFEFEKALTKRLPPAMDLE